MQKMLLLFLVFGGLMSTGCAGTVVYRERVYVGHRHAPPPPPPPVVYQPTYVPPPPPPRVIIVQQAPPPPAYGSPGYGPGYAGHGHHHHDHGRRGGGSTTVVNNTVVVAPTTTVQTGGRGRPPASVPYPGRVYAQPIRRN